MGKKTVHTFDGANCSVWYVIEHANTYYEFSKLFTDKLPASIHVIDPVGQRTDLAAASATNRILALELYLKALLIARKLPVPKEHNLLYLFDALPDDIRGILEAEYIARDKASLVAGRPAALEYIFSTSATLSETEKRKLNGRSLRTDTSLRGLLDRNKDGFVTSRYLFQIAKPNELTFWDYEHQRLAIICSVACDGLETSVPDRPASYKRHFNF